MVTAVEDSPPWSSNAFHESRPWLWFHCIHAYNDLTFIKIHTSTFETITLKGNAGDRLPTWVFDDRAGFVTCRNQLWFVCKKLVWPWCQMVRGNNVLSYIWCTGILAGSLLAIMDMYTYILTSLCLLLYNWQLRWSRIKKQFHKSEMQVKGAWLYGLLGCMFWLLGHSMDGTAAVWKLL